MNREELIRCTPEEVGISSESILAFLDKMNDGHAEMHSLMISRHDKIIAEGWWSPYSAGGRHVMMSTTKTVTGTMIGLMIKEGLLTLDTKIVDIIDAPDDRDPLYDQVTIRHLLTMSCGQEEACLMDEDYIDHFFHTPIKHIPGTDFYYNDSAVTLLPYILYKLTGLSIIEYLKPRLFDKIGIDTSNITWFNNAIGTAFGAGGLHWTTEDALRHMMLYKNGGTWNGEQILDREYVEMATSKQMSTNTHTPRTETLPKDNLYGYGFLMWKGSKPHTYRSEGAFGQITVVDPDLDMIVSFTEMNLREDPAAQESMDRVFEFLNSIDSNEILPYNELSKEVSKRFSSLSLERPICQPFGEVSYDTFKAVELGAHPEDLFYQQVKAHPISKLVTGITEFTFRKIEARLLVLEGIINGNNEVLYIPLDGSYRLNEIDEYFISKVLISAYFEEGDLVVDFRWIESVFHKQLVFSFRDKKCVIKERVLHKANVDEVESVFEVK